MARALQGNLNYNAKLIYKDESEDPEGSINISLGATRSIDHETFYEEDMTAPYLTFTLVTIMTRVKVKYGAVMSTPGEPYSQVRSSSCHSIWISVDLLHNFLCCRIPNCCCGEIFKIAVAQTFYYWR